MSNVVVSIKKRLKTTKIERLLRPVPLSLNWGVYMDLSNENIIHIKTKENEYIQFRKLLEYKDILTHAYSLGTSLNFRTSTIKKEELPKEVINYYVMLSTVIILI